MTYYHYNSYVFTPFFLIPDTLCGVLVITDQVKPDARTTVHTLHKMGLRVCMLTGDNRRTAKAIAEEVTDCLLNHFMYACYNMERGV